jgi:hypothetical protein
MAGSPLELFGRSRILHRGELFGLKHPEALGGRLFENGEVPFENYYPFIFNTISLWTDRSSLPFPPECNSAQPCAFSRHSGRK